MAIQKFNIGDLIVPKPPLKQIPGVILQVVDREGEEQDLEVLLQDDSKKIWVSSLDVQLLKYTKIKATTESKK